MNMKFFLLWAVGSCLFASEIVRLPGANSSHVDLRLVFSAGSVDDPVGQEGLTYLTSETLIEGGTRSLAKKDIDVLLYPIAVSFWNQVGKETATFSTSIHVDHVHKIYPIFRDLLLQPRFDPSDFSRVKEGALKAVSQDIPDNNDEVLSKRVLDQLMYAGHPFGHLVQGNKSSLEKLTLEDVKAHYARIITRARLQIGIAGKFTDTFASGLSKDFEALPEGTKAQKQKQVRMPNGIEALIVKKERAFGSAIFMGFPMEVDRSSDDFAALLVANSAFGEHRNSSGRLYQAMRAKRSLNYGDYSYMEWYKSGHAVSLPIAGYPRSINAFNIWIRPIQIAEQFKGIEGLQEPALGNAVHSVRQSIRELRLFVEKGLSQEEFDRSRTFMRGYLRHYVQSQSDRLAFLMDGRFYGRENYIEEMIQLMGKLTLADVNKALSKYLVVDKMYLAIITDDSEADKLAEALLNNASAPIVYKPAVLAGLDPQITEEDKLIDSYKLPVTSAKVIHKKSLFQ